MTFTPFSVRRLLLACGLLAACSMAHAENWPDPDWSTAPAPASTALSALEQYAFPPRDEKERKGVRTDALVVIRDGVLVYERYAEPTRASTAHLTWSMSKSLWATVMGVAYGRGLFRLDAPVAQYYPAFAEHPQIKMGHLLNWASGLNWQEDYEYAPLKSSVVAMLYTRGRGDMAAFTAAHEADAEPGTRFRYSSGDSNVLAAAMKNIVGEQAYADYPWTALFEPLGINSATWERDASGTYIASSYAYLTARDLARVGLLMQRDGRWHDKQLLPKAWVDFNRTPYANYLPQVDKPNGAVPGGQWWLNKAVSANAKPWPDVPDDVLVASGHWGQGLYVIPSKNLVVVRYADDRDGSFDRNHFLKLVMAALATEVQP
ncbi:serine hydrolase domain-containing protein [Pseudomonas sp. TTU2014-080ASC]|uniref:serine hydrolase domain-containing protein n=1 Tax=Pseudomonas sp. TTU2014-080ASC TaxID=1729724 RepID=UPI0007184FF2|nr:serine hydrolase [Pseudomonas sp. TTU2014-080ASC]KRW62680.1 serine hydrolase [Pseudomonas sp. TTU2014-080ASC]